jgi:hypothetical protein
MNAGAPRADMKQRSFLDASRAGLGALALGAALALAETSAAAQQAPSSAAPPAQAPGNPETPKPYEVEGFRSAKFGMTEAEVKRAIQVDFNIKEASIARAVEPVDRTPTLTITTNDILPDVGPVRVVYWFGYKEKKLFQVGLMWGAGVGDTAPNSTNVLGGAQVLLNYFASQNFKPENRIVNAQLVDGMNLLFQGIDEKGRMVQLQYGTVVRELPAGEKPDPAKPQPRIPFARLVYVQDPKNRDVYHIKPGQF